jgi:hypothetical protein
MGAEALAERLRTGVVLLAIAAISITAVAVFARGLSSWRCLSDVVWYFVVVLARSLARQRASSACGSSTGSRFTCAPHSLSPLLVSPSTRPASCATCSRSRSRPTTDGHRRQSRHGHEPALRALAATAGSSGTSRCATRPAAAPAGRSRRLHRRQQDSRARGPAMTRLRSCSTASWVFQLSLCAAKPRVHAPSPTQSLKRWAPTADAESVGGTERRPRGGKQCAREGLRMAALARIYSAGSPPTCARRSRARWPTRSWSRISGRGSAPAARRRTTVRSPSSTSATRAR